MASREKQADGYFIEDGKLWEGFKASSVFWMQGDMNEQPFALSDKDMNVFLLTFGASQFQIGLNDPIFRKKKSTRIVVAWKEDTV